MKQLRFVATPVVVAAMVIAALGGCTSSLNTDVPLIQPEPVVGRTDPAGFPADDRASWPVQEVAVMSGAVEHHPSYVRDLRLTDGPGGRTGEYPTAESVSADVEDGGGLVGEAVLGIPDLGWLILRAPFDMLSGRWPGNVERSPASEYQRVEDRPSEG